MAHAFYDPQVTDVDSPLPPEYREFDVPHVPVEFLKEKENVGQLANVVSDVTWDEEVPLPSHEEFLNFKRLKESPPTCRKVSKRIKRGESCESTDVDTDMADLYNKLRTISI